MRLRSAPSSPSRQARPARCPTSRPGSQPRSSRPSRPAKRGSKRKHSWPLFSRASWPLSRPARQRLVLGQEATDAKSNEITAIPLLLERLALTGALVTLDAMGCQTKIAHAIQAKGADYLIAVTQLAEPARRDRTLLCRPLERTRPARHHRRRPWPHR